jgi:myo-inositol-hexaphosphate 3-phosphohydrolase
MDGATIEWRCVGRAGWVISLLTLLAVAPAAADTLTRGPYLQLMRPTSVRVVWNTDGLAACGLTLRSPSGVPTSIAQGQGPVCAVSATGLSAGADYAYQPLADGLPLAEEATFRTPDASAPYTFLAVGDSGCDCDDQWAVRDQMLASPADFIVHTGDMIYPAGELVDFDPQFFVPYAALLRRVVFWPCLGNHDVRTFAGAFWRAIFHTPANNPARTENYYSFDYGNAHLVVLDSNADTRPGTAQHTFLDQDLAASPAPWKFVVFHHTIYSSGSHGSSPIRENLVPILDRHHVDLVLMGHDHHYERTYPLWGDQIVAAGEGTVYVTTGGGGHSIRGVGESDFTAYAESTFHFTRIAVDGGSLTLEMVRDDGVVRDTMRIDKVVPPPPPPPAARCGDGVVQASEACDAGDGNSDDRPDACRTTCTRASCGDGVVDAGEQCEPPAVGGCDASCRAPACPPSCDDGDPCSESRCDPMTGLCGHRTVPGCCSTATECDDADPCTADACRSFAYCEHERLALDPPPADPAEELAGSCGEQRLPRSIARRLTRAARLLGRVERAGPPRAARLLAKAERVLGGVARRGGRAAERGRISPACAAALADVQHGWVTRATCRVPAAPRSVLGVLGWVLGIGTAFAADVQPLDHELDGPGKNVDDPCFWVASGDPSKSLIFVTTKDSGLVEVFDPVSGAFVATITGFGRPNNCAVEGDLLLTTDRKLPGVVVHHLPDRAEVRRFGLDTKEPHGVDVLRTPAGQALVYVTDSGDASVHVYELESGKSVRSFPTGFGRKIEPILADDHHQRIFVAREEGAGVGGIGQFSPEGEPRGVFGAEFFASDTEGLALYACGAAGYLVAADQGRERTEFEVFDRVSLRHLGTFTLADGQGDATNRTDGIDILQTPLPGFPNGIFAACDGCGSTLPDEMDVVRWERIAQALGLDVCPDGKAPTRARGKGDG